MAKDFRKHEPDPSPHDPAPPVAELPADLARVQAEHTQSEPKVVPLERQPRGGDDAPPSPPVSPEGVVPRLIHQNERAPAGLKRFKIQCSEPQAVFRYVLAKDRESAVEHYLKVTGVTAVLEHLPETQRPRPRLSVRELPD